MASRVQSYTVTEGDLTLTVERATDADGWVVRGPIVVVLSTNQRPALETSVYPTDEAALTAASGLLVALTGFLDAADDLAA